jgi:hypothetical protein
METAPAPETSIPPRAGDSVAASGFVVGETEEQRIERKRKRWRENKQRLRLAQKVAPASAGSVPLPPLPSRLAPAPAVSAARPLVARSGAPAPDAGAVLSAPLVVWSGDDISSVVSELIDALERLDKADDVKLARLQKLSASVVEQIEKDAELPEFVKVTFKKYLPAVVAKYLNKAGIAAENKEEAALTLAALYYVADKLARRRNIQKLSGSEPAKIDQKK